jgi:hypothetical protein
VRAFVADFPPFPADWPSYSDYELGGILLFWFIGQQAAELGIGPSEITEEFGEQVRQRILTLETSTARNAPVQIAFHKAASGDFQTAGKLIREYLEEGAIAMVRMRFVAEELARRALGRRKGGQSTGGIRSRRAAKEHEVIRARKDELIARGTEPKDVAGILAREFRKSVRQIRNILSPPEAKKKRK